jgi:hypothetical protein
VNWVIAHYLSNHLWFSEGRLDISIPISARTYLHPASERTTKSSGVLKAYKGGNTIY